MEAVKRYQAWLENPLIEGAIREELLGISEDRSEIEDRFFRWLPFGTGGMRGKVGAGSNRMNVHTVRLVTQALANNLKEQDRTGAGVAIAYDSRHMSWEFACACAAVLAGNGILVYLFSELAPTPLLSYAVRHCGAAAGIMITASHNPPEYNGYKAYNEHGNQMLAEQVQKISSQLAELSLEDIESCPELEKNPLCRWLGEEIIQAYYQELLQIAFPGKPKSDLQLLFTPLHGTGARFVPEILGKAGFDSVATVPEQMVPHGDFPTVDYPNPEDPQAFRLAFQLASKTEAELIIATDPDADRLGVAVLHQGEWVLLNGNQLGVLLQDFLLAQLSAAELQKAVVVKTIVTTEMARSISKKYGAATVDTLTGFKYIGALIDLLPARGKEFVFGFEESNGYLAGTAVRDKDAVLASLLAAQLADFYKKQGLTLLDRLEQLWQEHGYYLQDLCTYSFASSKEAERSAKLMEQLKQSALHKIGTERIEAVLDYERSLRLDLKTKRQEKLDLPKENVLQWLTERGSKITLRPSGTEPKMKLYLEVRAQDRGEGKRRLEELKAAFDQIVSTGLEK